MAAADPSAPGPSPNLYSWLTSLSPAVIAVATALAGALAGWAGNAYLSKPGALPAADKPTPGASLAEVAAIGAEITVAIKSLDKRLGELSARIPEPKKAASK